MDLSSPEPCGRASFQRPYVWDEEHQWAPLWEDLRALAEELARADAGPDRRTDGHFDGAIFLQVRPDRFSAVPSRTIMDG